MLICRNAEGVHGKRKVENPCSSRKQVQALLKTYSNNSHSTPHMRNAMFAIT